MLACSLVSSVSGIAHADAPPECTRAYVAAQENRRAGRLQRAREELVTCGRAQCPAAIVADCAEWLREVEHANPSFVVAVFGADGVERTDARVSVDGVVIATSLDGRALRADPGAHDIRVSVPGEDELAQRVVLHEGEANRGVRFQLEPRRAPSKVVPAEVVSSKLAPSKLAPEGPEPPPPARVPTSSWILGGVGVAGLAVSSVFAASAFFGSPSLRTLGDCKPDCSQDQADKVHTKLVITDVALGVGIVALGAAIVIALTSHPSGSRVGATR